MYEITRMPNVVDIGYTGEKGFRKVEIDMSAWMRIMPDGVPSIVHIRPGESKDNAYIAETTFSNNILTWEITQNDLGAMEGFGLMQVWLEKRQNMTLLKRGKSVIVATMIRGAINDPGDTIPPARTALLNLTAESETLGANSNATAEVEHDGYYGDYNLKIGVPKGTTFTPSVDASGNLSWTNDGGKSNPPSVNIKGADGAKGEQGDPAPAEYVTPAVDAYLAENFTNPSNPPLDRTLLSSASATPADISGQIRRDVNNSVKKIYANAEMPVGSTGGYINATTGALESSGSATASDYIDISDAAGGYLTICATFYNSYGVAFYDSAKAYISGVSGTSLGNPDGVYATVQTVAIPSTAVYVRTGCLSVDKQDDPLTFPDTFAVSCVYSLKALAEEVSDLSLSLASKINNPSSAGTAGQALILNQSLQPVWGDAAQRTRIVSIAGADVAMGANGYVSGVDGTLATSDAAKCADYFEIPLSGDSVNVTGKACLYNEYGVAFYNSNKQYVSGISGTSTGTSSLNPQSFSVQVPSTAKYMRWCLVTDNSQIPGDFAITFTAISSFSDDMTALENRMDTVESGKINNPSQAGSEGQALILNEQGTPVWGTVTTPTETQTITIDGSDIDEGAHGFIKGTNGVVDTSASATSTDFIEIPSDIGGKVSGKAMLYNDYGIAFYNASKTFVSGITGTSIGASDLHPQAFNVNIPETAKYMRFSFLTEYASLPSDFTVTFTVPVQTDVIDRTGKISVMDNTKLNAETGGTSSTNTWITTGFIQITEAHKVSIQTTTYETGGIAFYDAEKHYISGISDSTAGETSSLVGKTKRFDVPAGTHFIRSTLYKGQSSFTAADFHVLFFGVNSETEQVLQYVNESAGNKSHNVLILGDSYSRLGDWVRGLCSGLDVAEIVNLGVVSATVRDRYANRTQYPYTDRPPASGTGNQNTVGSQVEKLKRLVTGTDLDTGEVKLYTDHHPDVVIIEGGMNDGVDTQEKVAAYPAQFIKEVTNVYYKGPGGTVTQGTYHIKTPADEVDRTSFAGTYRHICEEVLTLFPNAQIFIVTASRFNYFVDSPNYYDTIAKQQIESARYCAATVIDWNGEGNISIITDSPTGSGTQEDPYTVYDGTLNTIDGLHPNARGGRTYGRLAANVIKQRFLSIGNTV